MAINMENQVLSIEQMNHLKELGVDTSGASMAWQSNSCMKYRGIWHLYAYGNCDLAYRYVEKTFTLQDVIDLMPRSIDTSNELRIGLHDNSFSYWWVGGICDDELVVQFTSDKLITSAYEMLCWLAENDYLTRNEYG